MGEELRKLNDLLKQGIITQQDFYLKKAEILKGKATLNDLAELSKLKEEGILTEEEFFVKKNEALNASSESSTQIQTSAAQPVEEGSTTGWAVLSFFIPLVGLILFLVWKDTKPLASKACGKWALIGFIVSFVISLLSGLIAGCSAAMLYSYR